jgi:hypothetical protein
MQHAHPLREAAPCDVLPELPQDLDPDVAHIVRVEPFVLQQRREIPPLALVHLKSESKWRSWVGSVRARRACFFFFLSVFALGKPSPPAAICRFEPKPRLSVERSMHRYTDARTHAPKCLWCAVKAVVDVASAASPVPVQMMQR